MTSPANPEVLTRKTSERTPILSLVDRQYLKSTANIPKSAWEPLAYLYSEADKAVLRVQAMSVPGCKGVNNACQPDPASTEDPEVTHDSVCLEWVRQSCLKDWTQMLGWLDEVLIGSQSVDALRSWQMMGGLQSQNPTPRPSSVVMPDFPQPQPPGSPKPRGGMLRRKEPTA